MPTQPYRIGIVSDFNTQNLAVLLQKNSAAPGAKAIEAPFGQTVSLLLDEAAEFWSEPLDGLLIWTLPQGAVPGFQRVLDCERFAMEQLLVEVDSFCALVKRTPQSVRTILLPTFSVPGFERCLGPLDMMNNVGFTNTLMQMNLRLAQQFASEPRVVLLDVQRWLCAAGAEAFSPKLWYMSKTPFQTPVFREATADILAALDGAQGRSKKVLVLDLDNTLWGGVVGDEGWERLRLGGHDAGGEAYIDFQRGLKRLVNRGVLLALASKNEESVALEAIRRHPEMVLKLEDFAAWRINWEDKAQNITDLMAELNLGLDSAVFLDDSAFERARVREALPQVTVPELPADPLEYPSFLARLRYFDNPVISAEDRKRTSMYVADRQRVALKNQGGSLQEWLNLLDLRVEAHPLNEANLERAAQLLNKTNQMNLSTRRLTAPELMAWSRTQGHRLWTFRIADKFGDYGLCGLTSVVRAGTRGRLVDFVLSCRVMGRGVEESMLFTTAQHAKSLGCEELYAEFVPTAKNKPCEKWLEKHPKLRRSGNAFRLAPLNAIQQPAHVRIDWN